MTDTPQTDIKPEAPQAPKPTQYYAVNNGEQVGPYTEEALHELVANGTLPANAHIWAEGMTDWVPYYQVFTNSYAKKAMDMLNTAKKAMDQLNTAKNAISRLKTIKMSRNNIICISAIAAVVLGIFAFILMSGDSKWDKKYKQAMTLIFEADMSPSKYPSSHAYDLMEEAAEAGHAQAQLVHGFFLLEEEESETTGAKWIKKAAEQNNVYAQELMGIVYMEGIGTSSNTEKAAMWLKKAADKKNLAAGLGLLKLYVDKEAGGVLDKKEATELALELYNYGMLTDNVDIIKILEKTKRLPDGVSRILTKIGDERNIKEDKTEEWRIARTLAEEGNAWGQYIYGKGLMDSHSSSFEEREGQKYLEKAAKQKHVMAELRLAKFYEYKKYRDKASDTYRKLLNRIPVGGETQFDAWKVWGGAVPGEKEDED